MWYILLRTHMIWGSHWLGLVNLLLAAMVDVGTHRARCAQCLKTLSRRTGMNSLPYVGMTRSLQRTHGEEK